MLLHTTRFGSTAKVPWNLMLLQLSTLPFQSLKLHFQLLSSCPKACITGKPLTQRTINRSLLQQGMNTSDSAQVNRQICLSCCAAVRTGGLRLTFRCWQHCKPPPIPVSSREANGNCCCYGKGQASSSSAALKLNEVCFPCMRVMSIVESISPHAVLFNQQACQEPSTCRT